MLQDCTTALRSFEIRKKSSLHWILRDLFLHVKRSVSGLRQRHMLDKLYRLIKWSISLITRDFFRTEFPPFLSFSVKAQLKSPATMIFSCA